MDASLVKSRLLDLAQLRLKNDPSALDAFKVDLEFSNITDSPVGRELVALQFSNLLSVHFGGDLDHELIKIIDRWACSSWLPSVEPLPSQSRQRIAAPKVERPRSVGIAQGERILQLIRDQGHDPSALPVHRPGYRGTKANVKAIAITETSLFSSKRVFDAVWQKLRGEGRIKEVNAAGTVSRQWA